MPFLICPSCKYVIADASQPCPSCGNAVPLPAPAAQPEPSYQMNDGYDDYGAPKETHKKTGIVMLLFVIVLLAAGAFYFFRPEAVPASPIVGKWQADHVDLVLSYEFRPDNTVTLDMRMPDTITRLYWSKGTYETNGDQITITYEDAPSETGKFRLSGDTLTLIMEDGTVQILELAP